MSISNPAQDGSLPTTAYSLVEGLTRELSDARREKTGYFYQLYAVPLKRYLQRRFAYQEDVADEVVQAFLIKCLLGPTPQDSLAAKYLRRLGATYLSRREVPLEQEGLPTIAIDFLAKIGAAKLAGLKRAERNRLPGLDLLLLRIGADHFAEIRSCQDALSFRGYVLKAIYHFAVDEQRRRCRQVRSAEFADPPAKVAEPDESDEAEILLSQFVTVFRKAISVCRDSARTTAVHWDLFDAFIVEPSISGASQPTMGELAIRFREAIIESAAGERRAQEWTDEQVEKAARNRLDAIRRTLWQEVERVIETDIPESFRPDLREAIGSRGRNQLLRYFFRTEGGVVGVTTDSEVPFARYISTFLNDEQRDQSKTPNGPELRRQWLELISQPLYMSLCRLGVPVARSYKDCMEYEGRPLFNLDQCFRHLAPPSELVLAIKDATKSIGRRKVTEAAVAQEIAVALYATCVALMQIRHHQWASGKPRREFEQVFRTVMGFEWLDDMTRQVIQQCMALPE